MLLRLLKAFGLDIPARIEEFRERVEQAADEAKGVVRAAVVTAALVGVAAAFAAAALGIGLLALFRWGADSFGPFAGYGIVAGVLLFSSAVLVAVVFVRSRPSGPRLPAPAATRLYNANAADARSPAAPSASGQADGATATTATAATAASSTAAGLAELALVLLPVLMKSAGAGGSLADKLAATMRLGASVKSAGAVEGATAMVREGDRAKLLAAVAGAALVGWMMARQWKQQR